MEIPKSLPKAHEPVVILEVDPASTHSRGETDINHDEKRHPPFLAKLLAVFLISCISFGSHWSSGVTGAMKSTIKKVI